MAAAALQEGETFASRYRIVRELASGGMGAVYEVVHNVTERRCALKVMLAHTVEREQLRRRFMQESRLAAQIGSEYIVDVLDAGVDEDTKAPYLVMELLEGEDLGQRLLRQGPLPGTEAVSYLWHVALALDRTHSAGIVHRDLKASNLFLTRREDGTPLVKVLDFGVAKVLTLERSGAEQRTQTVGTPIYMAPEQFRAEGRISAATDIYALGMLAYTLLVGVHYWSQEHEKCENPFAFASIAVHGPKQEPTLRAAREGVLLPDAFDAWFARATARWPQDRFPTATDAVAGLAHALGVEGALVPAPTLPVESGTLPVPAQSSSASMPATLEAPSGRLSLGGPRTATPSVAPVVAGDPSHADGHGEQHTEISLTVTSGAGLPFNLDEPKPRTGRGAAAAAVAVALATALVTIWIFRPWQVETTIEPQKALQLEPPTGARKPGAQAQDPARKATTLDSLERDRVTRIEELPMAPPEPAAPPPTAAEPPRRPQPAGRSPKGRPPERAPAPPAESPSGPTAPSPERNAPIKATPLDRDDLYGRD